MMRPSLQISRIPKGKALFIFASVLFCLFSTQTEAALTVDIMSGYNLVVDSNITSPSTYGPASAYIGAKFCNTGIADLTDVFAYVGNETNNTPGIFPEVDTDSGTWPAHLTGTGKYSLTIEADETGAADGTRYIGTLGAGECRMQYWLISYPQCVNTDSDNDGTYEVDYPPCAASITGGVKPDDDLSLSYNVWANSGATTTVSTRTFTMRSEISAAANKIWPNGDNKVPAEYLSAIQDVVGWGSIGPDGQPLTDANPIYPGQKVITTRGIWYDLGNVGHGFDNDGDLIPDKNAWLQPVGDPAQFDPDCFRMVRNYGIVIVKKVGGGELLIPFENQLYFTNLPDNTGVVGLVYYQFIATDEGCSANMTPYQEAASGFDNEKFSGDFGLSLPLKSGSFKEGDFSVSKTDNETSVSVSLDPENLTELTYDITATNNTGVNLGAPEFGLPFVIRDRIPEGTTYVAGSATAPAILGTGSFVQGYTDSNGDLVECDIYYEIDSASSYYKLLYSIDNGATWTPTEPAAADVTDLKWLVYTRLNLDGGYNGTCEFPKGSDPPATYNYTDGILETSLAADQTAAVSFKVTVDTNISTPFICNTANFGFGESVSSVKAEDTTLVRGNNTLRGLVFVDNGGSTGIFGNGVRDGDEVGIGNAADGVVVTLYYDFNGNGVYDEGIDIEYANTKTGATITDATNGNYNYIFTDLADGSYLVVVKKYDGDTGDTDSVNEFTIGSDCCAGAGNTTRDPNLLEDPDNPPDQGILEMTENPYEVILAVNIDKDGNNTAAQTIYKVDFGFAPPLQVTKIIPGNPDVSPQNSIADTAYDEGDFITYEIQVENRLPSVGRQGPTGCEYVGWTTAGGTSGTGAVFVDYQNGVDGQPNRTVANARKHNTKIWGKRFNIPNMGTSVGITKVEALYFGYYGASLTNDFMSFQGHFINASDTITNSNAGGEYPTSRIDSYIGERDSLDPNNAISWNITTAVPDGASTWNWTDFSKLQLDLTLGKVGGGDGQLFYIDAIGVRVTSDAACEASDSTTLGVVPLKDTFDATKFEFISSDIPPDSITVSSGTGTMIWNNVGPIAPGSTKTVSVTLRAIDITGSPVGTPVTGDNSVTTEVDGKNVLYADERIANDDDSGITATIQGKGGIKGTVWNDVTYSASPPHANTDNWVIDSGEIRLPNVEVTLWACVKSGGALETGSHNSKTCATMTGGNSWEAIATTTTDENGDYEFIGLDTGYYIVEVGDTDNAVSSGTGGNSAPYGGSQLNEPLDVQTYTTTSGVNYANGPSTATDNNTWGNPDANLRSDQTTINLLNAATEETITRVNFGYNVPLTIYGTVWHDKDGSASRQDGENGLSGFTVELRHSGCTAGTDCPTTTTDSNGYYSFSSGISTGINYTIVVTPPTLIQNAWVGTVETSGGTTYTGDDLDDQLSITISSGTLFSGPHNFGYAQKSVSTIGDTVYYDVNGNGNRDTGEAGIPGVKVELYKDIDRDGTIDEGIDTVYDTVYTDANGKYIFENVPSGSYVVKLDTAHEDFPKDVIPTGDPDTNGASIGGNVLLGSQGVPGVVVLLYEETDDVPGFSDGDTQIAATTTDLNGGYILNRLSAGNYYVVVDENSLPDGLTLTTDPSGTMISLNDRKTADSVANVNAVVSADSSYALGNRVWYDVNADGNQNSGEAGIGGATVTVTGGSCGPSPGCQTTTDASGFWVITGLSNATYTVSISGLQNNFVRTNTGTGSSFVISDGNYMDADFGYRYMNATGLPHENDPTGKITGDVFIDRDGDRKNDGVDAKEAMGNVIVNLYDNELNLVATTTSDANGSYIFSGVPLGVYMVQSVDQTGTYTTTFLSAGEDYENLHLIYSPATLYTADSQSAVIVNGAYNDLNQDFGFKKYLMGSIGDTIYHDVNENATQDIGEPGIAGVTVGLYIWTDTDADGILDSGELAASPIATKVTTADDPLTAADEGGKYLFSNLDDLADNHYYVVKVDTATLPGTATLIADPDTNGVPCISSPTPDGCDNQQAVTAFESGINYMGADFGYRIVSTGYATIGDYVWIDADGDGVKDTGEAGVPYITVYIEDDGTAGYTPWTDANNNGKWDAGEGDYGVETDAAGYYVFSGLADGTYNIKVNTGDTDWPSSLPTTATYENGGTIDNLITVVVSGGIVTSVDGTSCSNCNLNADFGYRYTGTNTVHGTIGIDEAGAGANGYLGATATTYSGVISGSEAAISGVSVGFYQWNDHATLGTPNSAWAADGTLDSSDSFVFLGSTTTNANGDYSYSNLPDNIIVVFGVPESANLKLTTTNDNSSVEDINVGKHGIYEGTTVYDGRTVTTLVRHALKIGGDADNVIWDLDYAFDGTLGGAVSYDFGDLPTDYNITTLSNGGARHKIGEIRLGEKLSAKNDGTESPTANADPDDDGVELLNDIWRAGEQIWVKVTVTGGSGWLLAWVDFDGNNAFESGEMVINQFVQEGENIISFTVPASLTQESDELVFNSRFRLYESEPLLKSSTGLALDDSFKALTGEVEDYQWTPILNPTYIVVSSFSAYTDRGRTIVEWQTSAEIGVIGFHLQRKDGKTGKFYQLNDELLPALLDSQTGGVYYFVDETAQAGETYTYRLIEVEYNNKRKSYGPFEVTVGSAPQDYYADPEAGTVRYVRKGHEISAEKKARNEAAKEARKTAKANKKGKKGTIAKLFAETAGVYYLDVTQLAEIFNDPLARVRNLIRRGEITVLSQGKSVDWLPAPDNNGIYFYNPGIDSVYTDENVFWFNAGPGHKMAVVNQKLNRTPTGFETFNRTERAEENRFSLLTLFTDPEQDFWMWDFVFTGVPQMAVKPFNVPSPGLSPEGTALLKVGLFGITDMPPEIDHHAVVYVNGIPVGDVLWGGAAGKEFTASFNAAVLNDGDNKIEVQALKRADVPYSIIYIDAFELTYPSFYHVADNRLMFSAEGHSAVSASGFTGPDIMVFDITNTEKPKFVKPARIDYVGGEYTVTLPTTPYAVYFAVNADAVMSSDNLFADTPSSLRDRKNRADYVVIAPDQTYEAAKLLADYRASQGYKTMVVNIEDIMDEFNAGIKSPHAVRDFIAAAYYHWSVPPRYVALAGTGDYDYKNNWGLDANLIPPLLVNTPYGLFASDNRLADADDSGLPNVTIGRIPVVSNDELTAYIEKLRTYENMNRSDRILLLADTPDPDSGDFPSDSSKLMTLIPPEFNVAPIYLSQMSITAARQRLFDKLNNNGVGLISYMGHSGLTNLSGKKLLTTADLRLLNNAGKLPIAAFMTCLTGGFESPGTDSLMEALVLHQNGGVIAGWASTGLALQSDQKILAEELFKIILSPNKTTLGSGVSGAMKAYAARKGASYVLDIYTILGDPALNLRR